MTENNTSGSTIITYYCHKCGIRLEGPLSLCFNCDTNQTLSTPQYNPPTYDYINPDHYKKGTKEVYEMMIDIWGKDAYIAHCEMCAFKYRMRLGSKPDQPIERDLEKARWYEAKAKELKG